MLRRTLFALIIFFVGTLVSGILPVSAQDSHDSQLLREEFRSALMSDSRAASLSNEKLDSMVEALVQEAETQGVATDFVLPPVPALPEFAASESNALMTPWGQPIDPFTLYGVILVCLACAGLLLWWLLHLHKQTSTTC